MNSGEIYHHGILGMKWGIRRTKKQLGYETGSNKKAKNKSISKMSDEELRTNVNRLMMERQYLDLKKQMAALQPKEISKGRKFINSIGKDVVAPAFKDAGRNILTNFVNKKGSELLGLNEKKAKTLTDEVKELNLKKQKTQLDDFFAERDKKNKNKPNNEYPSNLWTNSEFVDLKFNEAANSKSREKGNSYISRIIRNQKKNTSSTNEHPSYKWENSKWTNSEFVDLKFNEAANSKSREKGTSYISRIIKRRSNNK